MSTTTTVGIDLGKSVFQVHGIDANGKITISRKLRRSEVLAYFANLPVCLVGMEACASAHFWAREIIALGHQVKLMPPKYVRAYVKRNKNDRADAEAICEAVQRPNMRFVPVKSELQQGVLILHRTRELLVRQRTQIVNALRGHWQSSDLSQHRVPAASRSCVAISWIPVIGISHRLPRHF